MDVSSLMYHTSCAYRCIESSYGKIKTPERLIIYSISKSVSFVWLNPYSCMSKMRCCIEESVTWSLGTINKKDADYSHLFVLFLQSTKCSTVFAKDISLAIKLCMCTLCCYTMAKLIFSVFSYSKYSVPSLSHRSYNWHQVTFSGSQHPSVLYIACFWTLFSLLPPLFIHQTSIWVNTFHWGRQMGSKNAK